MGPFEHAPGHLARWISTRVMIADFVGRQLFLRAQSGDDQARRFRFGTWRNGGLRRALSLEFVDTVELLIGGNRIDLAEVASWGDDGLRLDREALAIVAEQTVDLGVGAKRYQPSTVNREHSKRITELRDRQLQVAFDKTRARHPKWNKERIAKEIASSGEFDKPSWQRIARVARVRKK